MNMTFDRLIAQAEEFAYIAACESVGPNAHEFEALYERLYESLCEPVFRYRDLCQEGYSHNEALLKAGLSDPH